MSRLGALLPLVVFGVLAAAPTSSGPGSAEAAAMRQCRDVIIHAYGTIYTQTDGLYAKGVSCRRARAIAHAFLIDDGAQPPSPRGFACAQRPDASGAVCRPGGKRVSWDYPPRRPSRQSTRPVPKVECLVDGKQTYHVAPKGCLMYEHGSQATTILASMNWRNWGKKRTRGRGVIHFFDHPEYSGRVLVRLSRIAKGYCVPGRYYTRARIRVLSGRADGNAFTLNLAAGCPA